MVVRNFTVSKPAGAPAGAWQCSVLYTGLTGISTGSVRSASQFQAAYNKATALAAPVGPVTIMADGAAMEMIPDFTIGTISDVAVTTDTPYRVLAVGVEVHNTTAPMYRQGSVTTAILEPFTRDYGNVVYNDTNGAPLANREFQADFLADIPVNEAQLRVVPSARTWEASKGVYFVPRMLAPTVGRAAYNMRDAVMEFQSTGNAYYHSQPLTGAVVAAGAVNLPVLQSPPVSGWTPMMSLFTGLSDQTTLTVTLKCLVEIFPQANSPLAPMSSPSAPYDCNALTAYSMIPSVAPYAVPVSENSAGDFFRKIITAAKTAAPLLGLIPHVGTFLGAAGPLAASVADGIVDILDPQAKPRHRPGGPVSPDMQVMFDGLNAAVAESDHYRRLAEARVPVRARIVSRSGKKVSFGPRRRATAAYAADAFMAKLSRGSRPKLAFKRPGTGASIQSTPVSR